MVVIEEQTEQVREKKCGAAISEMHIFDFLKRQKTTLQIYILSKLFWIYFHPWFRQLQTRITIGESGITILKPVKSVQNHFFQPLQNLPLVSDGGDMAPFFFWGGGVIPLKPVN